MFNFEFSQLIQVVLIHKPKDVTDPFKICMYAQILLNQATSATTIRHAHPTVQKTNGCEQKIKREFLLVEGIQKTELHAVISIDASASNDPMRQQTFENITCYKCREKGY